MKVDDLAPTYLGAQNIQITPAAPPGSAVLAGRPALFSISLLNEAEDDGLVLPLDLSVTDPDGNIRTTTYTRLVPKGFAFTPRQGGQHLVVIAERSHNYWRGSLVVDVVGDRLTDE